MSIETAVSETAIEQNIEQFLLVLSVSLSVATVSRVFSWFRRIPFTLLLVIVGLILAFVDVRLVAWEQSQIWANFYLENMLDFS